MPSSRKAKGRRPVEKTRKQPARGRRRVVNVGDRLTRTQIARRSGIDRDTVRRYLATEGAPKPDDGMRYSYRAALEWIQKQAPRLASNSDEMRRIRESIAKMEEEDMSIDLAVKRKLYVPKTQIAPTVAEVMRQFTEDLQAKFEEELPPKYEGVTTIERQRLNAAAIDWILTRFKTGTAGLTK